MSLRSRLAFLEDEDFGGLLELAKQAALRPIRPFVSRSARRTYLTTALIFTASFALLGLAIAAYILFYWSYIPRIGFQRTVHLQFDHVFHHAPSPPRPAHPYPYGTVSLAPDLVGAQAYDITIELALPRTRANRNAGNFMLDVTLYTSDPGIPSFSSSSSSSSAAATTTADTALSPVAHSRRPALLPYRSLALDTLYRLTELPLYLFNFRTESAVIRVPVFESVAFPCGGRGVNLGGGAGVGAAGSGVPKFLHLEVQSAGSMDITAAHVHVRARFRGLRWLMYNHRIFAALLGVATFWVTEVLFAGLAWGYFAAVAAAGEKEEKAAVGAKREPEKKEEEKGEEDREGREGSRIKGEAEEEDGKFVLSDTERTFPTFRGQPPLRYSSPGAEIKREDDETAVLVPEALTGALDADDEDEEEEVDYFDSGIGTSLESSGPSRRDSMRRRKGRAGTSEERGG